MTGQSDIMMRFGADIEPLKRGAKGARSELSKISDVAAKGRNQLALLGAAATASGAAFLAMARHVAATSNELRINANLSNTSIAAFKKLAFAANTVNIESDKLGDILKDVNDRVGDFVQTGAGPMADFFENIAPKIGVTVDQFKNLSGDQALKLYIDSLNKANLSQADMVFYMEAIASDSSRLLPLFADNGKELERLTDRYAEVNDQLALTANQSESLSDLNETFNLLGETASNAGTQIMAIFADPLNDFLTNALDLVPKVTNKFVDFFNTFMAAGDINSIAQVEAQIIKSEEAIAELEKRKETARRNVANGINQEIAAEKQRLAELQAQLLVLNQQNEARALNKVAEGGSTAGPDENTIFGTEQAAIEVEIYENHYKTLEEIQQEHLSKMIGDYEMYAQSRMQSGEDWRKTELEKAQEFAEAQKAIREAEKMATIGIYSSMFGNLSSLMSTESKTLFAIGKEAAIGQALMDGAVAAISSYKAGAAIGGPVMGAAYAATSAIATGVMIDNIRNQSFGGGGSTSTPSVSEPQAPAQTAAPEQTRSIRLEQLDPNSLVSGAMVNNLAEQLVELQKDGFTLVV